MYDYSTHMKYPKYLNPQKQRVEQWLPKAGKVGYGGLLFKGYRVSMLQYKKNLEMDVVRVAQQYKCH